MLLAVRKKLTKIAVTSFTVNFFAQRKDIRLVLIYTDGLADKKQVSDQIEVLMAGPELIERLAEGKADKELIFPGITE